MSLNSGLSHGEYIGAIRRLRSGEARLLYVAPETLLRPETLVLLDECGVKLITIDEAHCISEWGHDFRPEYRQLRTVRDRYPKAVCLALTATATERVRGDIRRTMGISEEATFIAPFDRPNLILEVRRRQNGVRQITDFIKSARGRIRGDLLWDEEYRSISSLRGWKIAEFVPCPTMRAWRTRRARENQRRFHARGCLDHRGDDGLRDGDQ